MTRTQIIIPRDVLLVEIERRCPAPSCNKRTRIGLTKDEARAYCGFECEHCKRRWDDVMTERDVPEWWEELTITGLLSLRERRTGEIAEPNETVRRMSDAYREQRGDRLKVGDDSF
jgi:hypothetical protein